MRIIIFFLVAVFVVACKAPQGNDDKYDPAKTYKLQLNPPAGSVYRYEVTNEASSVMEVNDKEVKTENETSTLLDYGFARDSAGNLLLQVKYDKIHLYNKSGETVTDITADASTTGYTPTEKIVHFIRGSDIRVTMNGKGEVLQLSGYQEIGDKIAGAMDPNDIAGQNAARDQWDETFGDALVKKNLDQLFKIFPDSSVAIDDEWKLTSKQPGEFPVTVTSVYKLKTINEQVAIISSTGNISSEKQEAYIQGYGKVATNLSGTQESEFEMEKETGMLLSCRIKATIEGTVQVMGREIPVKIKSLVTVKGKKK